MLALARHLRSACAARCCWSCRCVAQDEHTKSVCMILRARARVYACVAHTCVCGLADVVTRACTHARGLAAQHGVAHKTAEHLRSELAALVWLLEGSPNGRRVDAPAQLGQQGPLPASHALSVQQAVLLAV